MAVERWCEVRNDQIVNTLLVDPDTQEGQDYLAMQEEAAVLMLPEDEAKAQYPYAPPPFRL